MQGLEYCFVAHETLLEVDMKRRDFIKKAGVVAASASLSPLMFAKAQSARFRLGMVTSWPTALDTIFGGATNVARYVNEMTDGDVEIDVFPAGAEVGALEVYDAVSAGAFEMGHTASYYYIGKQLTHGFFTGIPFGLNVAQQNSWMLTGDGEDLWNELNEPDNLIAFCAGNTNMQSGGWFRQEINSVEDLQGLRMRIPSLGGLVMARAGVNVQLLPGGEIFLALERGVVDAAEWVGPYDDEILGLHNAAPFLYGPGWQEPCATLGTYVNLDVFNDLPSDIQSVIKVASHAANGQMAADYDAKNPVALNSLVEGGTQVRLFPTEVLEALEGYMDEIHEENVASNPFYARVYQNWDAFRQTVLPYAARTDAVWLQYIHRNAEI